MNDNLEAKTDKTINSVLNIIKFKDIKEFDGNEFSLKDLKALEGDVKKRIMNLLDKEVIEIINNDLKNSEDEKDYIRYELFYLMIALSDVDASDINDNKKEKLKALLNKIILEKLKIIKDS